MSGAHGGALRAARVGGDDLRGVLEAGGQDLRAAAAAVDERADLRDDPRGIGAVILHAVKIDRDVLRARQYGEHPLHRRIDRPWR